MQPIVSRMRMIGLYHDNGKDNKHHANQNKTKQNKTKAKNKTKQKQKQKQTTKKQQQQQQKRVIKTRPTEHSKNDLKLQTTMSKN